MSRKRVVLIDDHPVVMQGVRELLTQAGDFEIVGEARTGAEGVEMAASARPDLIVLDLRIGEELAPDVCDALQAADCKAQIVIFTAFDDEALLLACQKRGVGGILLKDTYGINLVRAFRDICGGRRVIDPRIDSRRLERAGAGWDGADDFERLTDREYQILRLLSRGLTSREIAGELNLALNTVRSYTQEVLVKLRASNRVQAVANARRLHLI